jgi:hypothetical protein
VLLVCFAPELERSETAKWTHDFKTVKKKGERRSEKKEIRSGKK